MFGRNFSFFLIIFMYALPVNSNGQNQSTNLDNETGENLVIVKGSSYDAIKYSNAGGLVILVDRGNNSIKTIEETAETIKKTVFPNTSICIMENIKDWKHDQSAAVVYSHGNSLKNPFREGARKMTPSELFQAKVYILNEHKKRKQVELFNQ